jgi:hypothetical protein
MSSERPPLLIGGALGAVLGAVVGFVIWKVLVRRRNAEGPEPLRGSGPTTRA